MRRRLRTFLMTLLKSVKMSPGGEDADATKCSDGRFVSWRKRSLKPGTAASLTENPQFSSTVHHTPAFTESARRDRRGVCNCGPAGQQHGFRRRGVQNCWLPRICQRDLPKRVISAKHAAESARTVLENRLFRPIRSLNVTLGNQY